MKDVRCIQRECSFRRDRTLLYCNISCESTDGLLLLLLDTLSKHLAADWMNLLSISGLLQSVRSAARGERPPAEPTGESNSPWKEKTLQPAAVPRTLRQTRSLTGLVLAWARKSRNVTINLQDSSLTFSQNFAFCANVWSLRQIMFSGRLGAVRKIWRKQTPPPLRTKIISIEYTLQFYDMLYYLYWDKNKSM